MASFYWIFVHKFFVLFLRSSLNHTRKIVARALKLVCRSRYGNKVWVAPSKSSHGNSDGAVLAHLGPTATFPSKMAGYERKTRRGNRQWVGAREKPVRPVLRGGPSGARPGQNRKWVRGRHSSLSASRSNPSSSSYVRRSLTRWRPSAVVCLEGGARYSVDHTGKRLKRMSVSCSSVLSVDGKKDVVRMGGGGGSGGSCSVSGFLGTARTSFIKRKMAR